MSNLQETLQELEKRGFTDQFKPGTEIIGALKSNHAYYPEQLKVIEKHQFKDKDGKAATRELLVMEGIDGIKGTMVWSHGNHPALPELIAKIPVVKVKQEPQKETPKATSKKPVKTAARKPTPAKKK